MWIMKTRDFVGNILSVAVAIAIVMALPVSLLAVRSLLVWAGK